MKSIQSRSNPAYRKIARLAASSRECRLAGLALVEGERLLSSLLAAGKKAALLITADSAQSDNRLQPLLSSIDAAERIILSDSLFSSVSQVVSGQGVMALIEVPPAEPWPSAAATTLLLEGIQDPGNLGSILRSAVAAGVRHIALSPGSASAWAPKVMRAGMGAHFHLSIHQDEDLLERATTAPGIVAATSPHATATIYEANLNGPITWIFGNEGAGLSQQLMDLASLSLRIPMSAQAESLNVAATVAVCLFEQLRQGAKA